MGCDNYYYLYLLTFFVDSSSEDSDDECARELSIVYPQIDNDAEKNCNQEYDRIRSIVQKYCSLKKEINWKTNVLLFYKDKDTEMYVLSKIIFGAPASQVSVERLFSHLKFILNAFRNSLGSDILNDVLLVRLNEKNL